MKITAAYIIKKLVKDYGYHNMSSRDNDFVNELIKDILKIVDEKLKTHKNISIK